MYRAPTPRTPNACSEKQDNTANKLLPHLVQFTENVFYLNTRIQLESGLWTRPASDAAAVSRLARGRDFIASEPRPSRKLKVPLNTQWTRHNKNGTSGGSSPYSRSHREKNGDVLTGSRCPAGDG